MLEAIAGLGKYTLAKRNLQNPLQLLVLDPRSSDANASPNVPVSRQTQWWVLAFRFAVSPQNWRYCGLVDEQYDSAKALRYYLTEGSSMGPLGAPTAQLTEPGKTLDMRILGWAKKAKDLSKQFSHPAQQFLIDFSNALTNNRAQMLHDLEAKYQGLKSSRSRFVVTCQLVDSCNHEEATRPNFPTQHAYGNVFSGCVGPCYPGDLQPVIEVHRKMVMETFGKRQGKAQCAVCRQTKDVSGRILSEVFPFGTLDKPGFVAGGLDPEQGWKVQPICFDCFLLLKEGRNYVEKNMTFKFYGNKYWLVPQFMVDTASNPNAINVLKLWDKSVRINRTAQRRLTDDLEEILDDVAQQGDFLTLNFVFLRGAQAKEEILLSVEDVLPSRLKTIFDAKDSVDKAFHSAFGSRQSPDYNLGKLRDFFVPPGNFGDKEAVKPFLDITGRILRGQPVSDTYITRHFIDKIRADLAPAQEITSSDVGLNIRLPNSAATVRGKGYTRYLAPVDALMNLEFLEHLGLIPSVKGGAHLSSNTLADTGLCSCLETFFANHHTTFSTPERKAAFLIGSFVQMLLDVQASSRDGATPFWKKLKGLKLSTTEIAELVPEVYNKLKEYDKLTVPRRELATCVAHYLAQAGEPAGWQLSTDQANLLMVMGMSLLQPVVWNCMPKREREAEEVPGMAEAENLTD